MVHLLRDTKFQVRGKKKTDEKIYSKTKQHYEPLLNVSNYWVQLHTAGSIDLCKITLLGAFNSFSPLV